MTDESLTKSDNGQLYQSMPQQFLNSTHSLFTNAQLSIDQQQWNTLYSKAIAPLSEYERQKEGLSVKAILQNYGFAPDLSSLSLRNLSLSGLDFGGVKLDYADLRGATCHFTQFKQASFSHLYVDNTTKHYPQDIDLERYQDASLTQNRNAGSMLSPKPY